jgi:hypothetical protein
VLVWWTWKHGGGLFETGVVDRLLPLATCFVAGIAASWAAWRQERRIVCARQLRLPGGLTLHTVAAAIPRFVLMVATIVLGAWWLQALSSAALMVDPAIVVRIIPGVLSVSLMLTATFIVFGVVPFFVIEYFLCRRYLARILVPGQS